MSELLSITIPGWLTGVGTLALAGATLYLTKRERDDRKDAEQREREERARRESESEERAIAQRREQSSLVSAWHADLQPRGDGQPESVLALSNRSDEPVYDVIVTLVLVQGAGPSTGEQVVELEMTGQYLRLLGVVPPGLWQVSVDGGWGGMYRAPGAEIAFTDRSGVRWIRRADGRLEEIGQPAMEHYGLTPPLSMTFVEPFNI